MISSERRGLSAERAEGWLSDRERWSRTWRDSAEDSAFVVRLSPARTRDLVAELIGVVDRYLAGNPAADARNVGTQLDVCPAGRPA